jgi:hypothetical protein
VKVIYPDKSFHRYLYENRQNPQVLIGVEDGKEKRFAVHSAKAIPIPLPFPINVITGTLVCKAVNCDQLIANTVQTVTDAVSKVIEDCKNNPDCHKATNWELKQAGIVGKDAEHQYKKEHGAKPVSHFDICKCKDGSIRIAKVGMCGKTNDFWD